MLTDLKLLLLFTKLLNYLKHRRNVKQYELFSLKEDCKVKVTNFQFILHSNDSTTSFANYQKLQFN